MPTYKELWYADVNTPINPSVISATEATSVGDKLEILQNALPVQVTSAAARNELYPDPVQGDSVYRLDLGFEERYYETYSSQKNLGGKPSPGWYEVNSGPKEIINAVTTVSSGYLQYDNVFTSDYTFWKINYDIRTVTSSGGVLTPSATTLDFRFTAGGTPITTAQYYYTRIVTSASVGTSAATSGATNRFILGASAGGNGTIHGGEITLSDVFTKNYPKFMHGGYHSSPTSGQCLDLVHGYYNSTSTTIDGFRIYSVNSSDPSDGNLRNITVMGYN